ncbi:MAG: alpha/beta fold hydrolase [Ilumatobacteraceae bacterium]
MRRLAPERPVLLPLSLAAALLVGACSATDSRVEADSGQRLDDVTATSDSSSTGSSSSGSSSGDSLDWSECGGPQIECARLEVPLDHSDPSLGTLSLAVTRRLADDEEHRIGSLLVNPGGPGVGTSFLAESAEFIYGQDLLDRFDIVAMDPRGVGESEPVVDCVDEYDPYFSPDPTPDDAAERQVLVDASAEFAAACADRVGTDLLQHVSTIDAARDFDLLRQALGETKISYFGFSYGSQLGATWLSMFPDTVRAAVLDSASAPDPSDDQAIEDAVALDRAFRSFLDDCAADTSCAFHSDGDPESAYNALLDQLDADPIVVDPDRTPVNEAVTVIATLAALYDSSSWPDLARALDAARDGDGSRLLSAYDDYLMRQPDGTYDNSFEGLLAINCIDDPGPHPGGLRRALGPHRRRRSPPRALRAPALRLCRLAGAVRGADHDRREGCRPGAGDRSDRRSGHLDRIVPGDGRRARRWGPRHRRGRPTHRLRRQRLRRRSGRAVPRGVGRPRGRHVLPVSRVGRFTGSRVSGSLEPRPWPTRRVRHR